MIRYENKTIINAKPDMIFTVFMDNAKDNFKKINLNNPVGAKSKKEVSKNNKGNKKYVSELEITDFKKNKIYEISFRTDSQTFISRYVLNKIDDTQTELVSIEKFISGNKPNKIIDSVTKFFYGGQVKKRFKYIVSDIQSKIK